LPLRAGVVDMRRPLTPDEVAAIHAGMDRYAVLAGDAPPWRRRKRPNFLLVIPGSLRCSAPRRRR
jgi:hypothetical protein